MWLPGDCLENGRSCLYTCLQNLLRCTSRNRTHDAGWCLSSSPRPPPQSVKDKVLSSTGTRAATASISPPSLSSAFVTALGAPNSDFPSPLTPSLPHSPLTSSSLPPSPLTSPPPSLPTHLPSLTPYSPLRTAQSNLVLSPRAC